MSHERMDFTLLRAALDLTSSLDLKSGLQNFVDQACALTSSPHATMCVLDTWGATALRLEHHDSYPAPPVPESLPAVIPVNAPLHQLPAGRARHRSARLHPALPRGLRPRA